MLTDWLRDPGHLRWLFLLTMAALASALVILALRIIQQDGELAIQRAATRQELDADLVVAGLTQRLQSVEAELDDVLRTGAPSGPARNDVVVVLSGQNGFRAWPRESLPFHPDVLESPEPSPPLLVQADELEYRERNYSRAISILQSAASSTDPRVRAPALLALGRNHVKAGQPQRALESYRRLESLEGTTVVGMPAVFAARLGLIAVLNRTRDTASLQATIQSTHSDLMSARWPIGRSAFEVIVRELERAIPQSTRHSTDLAEALSDFWDRPVREEPSGRALVNIGESSVLVVWRNRGSATAACVMRERAITQDWLPPGFNVTLTTDDGRMIGGRPVEGTGRPSIRLSSSTLLPWTVQMYPSVDRTEAAAVQSRRLSLLAGAAILLAFLLIGAGFVGHTMTREIAVARMQSSFVAGVSHEFRTPLTTLCQISELLTRDRVASESDRKTYYGLIHAESQRLRRLVENLLMFGALEAGQIAFRREPIDLGAFVAQSVHEFVTTHPASAHRVRVEPSVPPATVSADADALRTLLWNLIDNALKYSADPEPVIVSAGTRPEGGVVITVRDRGIGIPLADQRRIFDKFVRGTAARAGHVRGTGVGLALVREIARAHGGDVSVQSEAGTGSTFSVSLP